jgi:hypothetical protein
MRNANGSLYILESRIPMIPSGTRITRSVWSYDKHEWQPLSAATEEIEPAEPKRLDEWDY